MPGKYSGDDFEGKEIGEVCTECEREEKYAEGGSEETQEGIRTIGRSSVRWEDCTVIDVRKKMQRRGVDRISKDKLWVFVNTAMNLWVLYIAESFLPAEELSASREGPGSKKSVLVCRPAVLSVPCGQRVASFSSPCDMP